jgi:hypothetical protein
MVLEKELTTFEKNRDTLMAHEGKYVLIHDTEIAGFFDTYEDAVQSGYQKFSLTPFLVKKIQAVEQVQHLTRDAAPCRT